NTATPYICAQLACSGIFAKPDLIASHAAPNTPICLPTKRPSITPSGNVSKIIEGLIPANEIPALEKPNKGTMKKATGLVRACSSLQRGELSTFVFSDAE